MAEKPSWILQGSDFVAVMAGGTNKAIYIADTSIRTLKPGVTKFDVPGEFWELIANEDDNLAEPGNWIVELDAPRPAFLVEAPKAATESIRDPNAFDPSKPINWNDMSCKVANYFTVRDVTQGHRNRIPQSNSVKKRILAVAAQMDRIRVAWGGPVGVTSWYRPPAVNRAVGGARYSQHIQGHGVDIYPIGRSIYEFQKWLDPQWYSGLGYGAKRGFVHIDMRHGNDGFDGKKGSVRWHY